LKLERPEHKRPTDAAARQAKPAVICYPPDSLAPPDLNAYQAARKTAHKSAEAQVPPRDARCIDVPAGSYLRITSVDGPQVGDLNLWAAGDLTQRFYSGKTRDRGRAPCA